MDTGFITLHRKITDNPIWKNSQLSHLFLTLLLWANHEEKKTIFNGKIEVIGRGQLITGRFKLAEATNISPNTIKEHLNILETLGIITKRSTNKFTLITINKYSDYQDIKGVYGSRSTNRSTNQTPTRHQPDTTNNNVNNDNNVNQEGREIAPSQKAKEFFETEQVRRLIGIQIADKYKADIQIIAEEIRKFTNYWREKNKSGTREKWQLQQTFEVNLRLETWLRKYQQFNKTNQPKRTRQWT